MCFQVEFSRSTWSTKQTSLQVQIRRHFGPSAACKHATAHVHRTSKSRRAEVPWKCHKGGPRDCPATEIPGHVFWSCQGFGFEIEQFKSISNRGRTPTHQPRNQSKSQGGISEGLTRRGGSRPCPLGFIKVVEVKIGETDALTSCCSAVKNLMKAIAAPIHQGGCPAREGSKGMNNTSYKVGRPDQLYTTYHLYPYCILLLGIPLDQLEK